MKKKVIVIGGGASGLMAAIAAATEGAEVTILEHMDRVGKKLLSTGNGRCNMTNLAVKAEFYRCGRKSFPMRILDKYSVWDTLTFFDELGIVTKSKNGYIYPNSEQASAVLNALRLEAGRLNITTVCNCHVTAIEPQKKKLLIIREEGALECDAAILACGSQAAPATGSDGSGYEIAGKLGHRIIKPLPALVQLRCEGKYFKALAGIRCEAKVSLLVDETCCAADTGELQLTDYGISGIPTFQVSRFAAVGLDEGKRVTAKIDFLPSKNMEESIKFINHRVRQFAYRNCEDLFCGVFNQKLSAVLLKQAGILPGEPVGNLKKGQIDTLRKLIKSFETKVVGTNSYAQAQVCCGGIDTGEIRPATLESKLVPGLYFAGEIIDVDGICGGYNLQWAWSTGMIAGRCAGKGNDSNQSGKDAG